MQTQTKFSLKEESKAHLEEQSSQIGNAIIGEDFKSSLDEQVHVQLKINSYTPIAAPNSLKMLQSRTEEQATRITYSEKNSSYATNVPQKQLFIENEYDSRKVPVTIEESARDASNDTRIDASHFS